MRLINHSPNCNEVCFNNGNSVLFSYQTVVVVVNKAGVFKTGEKYSRTTSKHINAYTHTTLVMTQGDLEKLAAQAAVG
jgi:hypothetical protein